MQPLIDGDRYYVTMCGKVFVRKRIDIIHGRHPTPYHRTYPEKQLKTTINKLGYKQVGHTFNGKRKLSLVHRLVANAFIPNPLNLPEVNHKNGDKSDNKVNNLEWVSRSDNALHASAELGMRGSNIGNSKLDEFDVLAISAALCEGKGQTDIAKVFGVSNHCIYRIAHGYNWGWLTGFGRKEGTDVPKNDSAH